MMRKSEEAQATQTANQEHKAKHEKRARQEENRDIVELLVKGILALKRTLSGLAFAGNL